MLNEIAQLKADLDTEKAVNLALCQKPQSKFPSAVKPALLPAFYSKIDGTSVSKFVHQLDVYFDLVDLTDDVKRGQIVVGLLEGQAHTWYQLQGIVSGFPKLGNSRGPKISRPFPGKREIPGNSGPRLPVEHQ